MTCQKRERHIHILIHVIPFILHRLIIPGGFLRDRSDQPIAPPLLDRTEPSAAKTEEFSTVLLFDYAVQNLRFYIHSPATFSPVQSKISPNSTIFACPIFTNFSDVLLKPPVCLLRQSQAEDDFDRRLANEFFSMILYNSSAKVFLFCHFPDRK